jgi:AcrR family transcriptional regulator
VSRPRTFDDDVVKSAARELFWTHGYERTSISDIAEATGLGNGSLYAAFGSKLGLFLAVLDAYCLTRIEIAQRAMATPGSPNDAVHAFFEAIVADCASQPERRGCLMLNSIAEFGSREPRVLELCRRTNERMESAIEERLRGTDLPLPVSMHLLAAQVLLVSQGLIQASRLNTPTGQLRAIAQEYCDRLPVA